MIALDNHKRWQALSQAYGSAEEIPSLIQIVITDQFENATNDAWPKLQNALYHQGTIYSASIAAAPHLLKIGASQKSRYHLPALHLLTAILVAAECGRIPSVEADVMEAYETCLKTTPQVLFSTLAQVVDEHDAIPLLATIAVLEGHKTIGYNLFHADPEIVCPSCEATFPRYYDLDENYSFADDQLPK